jgi:hypothetical protein
MTQPIDGQPWLSPMPYDAAWKIALEHAQLAVEGCREAGKALVDDDGKPSAIDYPSVTALDDLTVIAVAKSFMDVLHRHGFAAKRSFRPGDGLSWDDPAFGGAP